MDCDKLIDGLLSCSGEQLRKTKELLVIVLSPGTLVPEERQGNSDFFVTTKQLVRKPFKTVCKITVKGSPRLPRGVKQGGMGYLLTVKKLTASHIEVPDDSEIERLYARYEARLGAAMTLGSAELQLYAGVVHVSMFLQIPDENQPGLIVDLEGDPFIGHALSSATCELYHRYGMFLAPLTTAMTTIKHRQFGHRCSAVINDGNKADRGEPAGRSDGTARINSFARGAGT